MPPFRYPSRLPIKPTTAFRAQRLSIASFLSHHQQLQLVDEVACRLKSRSVLLLRGPDALKFLQNLVTNDVRPLAMIPAAGEGNFFPTPNLPLRSPPPIYSVMLNGEGRFLYDMFLYRQPRPEEKLNRTGSGPGSAGREEELTVLADVDAAISDEILGHFRRYRLRAKVEIEDATKEFDCWQRFGGDLSKKVGSVQEPEAAAVGWGSGVDCVGESVAQGNSSGWKWFKDPRLDSLGLRGIFPSNTVPPLVEADKEADERHYLLRRLEIGVAEGSTEIPKGVAIPLEYNLVGLNAISFDKGCYTGQELVARTHHRGVVRKRLLPLKFVDDREREVEQEISPGSEVMERTSGKVIGTVATAMGSCGMGVLRLEEAFGPSSILSIKEKDGVKVRVFRPHWWPEDWMQSLEKQRVVA